jgi:hypothetical protein
MISLEERNQLIKKGPMVESSTTPNEWKHGLVAGCQLEVPQKPVDLSFLLTKGIR